MSWLTILERLKNLKKDLEGDWLEEPTLGVAHDYVNHVDVRHAGAANYY